MTENILYTQRQQRWLNTLFVLFVSLILFTRLVVFLRFNLDLIDTDQPYMWQGAVDYARGFFPEPRYYGQDYNTFMEALFAVPLVLLNVPVYYAVPFATHFISLFPFLFTAFYLFIKGKKIHALLALAVIMCLPISYDMLNSLPRGFVTGLFFNSFCIISILNPQNMLFVCLNTLLAVTGYYVNPNSVLVSGPFLFYIFLHHYKHPRYYAYTIPALLCAWPAHLFFDQFYIDHPHYILHPLDYQFSTAFFLDSLSNLDLKFVHVSFFLEQNCLFLIAALVLLGIFLYGRDKKGLAALGALAGLLLLSLCFGKTSEGSAWVFISASRMFLGIPLLITLLLSVLPVNSKTIAPLLIIPLVFSIYKLTDLERCIGENSSDSGGVRLLTLPEAINLSGFYKKKCEENNADFFVVSSRYWANSVLSCGGPALFDNYPETIETRLEKRYWVRERNNNRVVKQFVILSCNYDLDKEIQPHGGFEIQRLDNYGLFLVKNNTRKMGQFLILMRAYEPFN